MKICTIDLQIWSNNVHGFILKQEMKCSWSKNFFKPKQKWKIKWDWKYSKVGLENQMGHDLANILLEVSSLTGLKIYQRNLCFNGWIFCNVDFSEVGHYNFCSIVLSV